MLHLTLNVYETLLMLLCTLLTQDFPTFLCKQGKGLVTLQLLDNSFRVSVGRIEY